MPINKTSLEIFAFSKVKRSDNMILKTGHGCSNTTFSTYCFYVKVRNFSYLHQWTFDFFYLVAYGIPNLPSFKTQKFNFWTDSGLDLSMAQCLHQQALKHHLPQYILGNSLILHPNSLPATSKHSQGFQKVYELITYVNKRVLYQLSKWPMQTAV